MRITIDAKAKEFIRAKDQDSTIYIQIQKVSAG